MKQFGVVIIVACFVFALFAESSLCSLCTKSAGTCPLAEAAEIEEAPASGCGSGCGGCGESGDAFPLMAQKFRELRAKQEQSGCSQCPSRQACAATDPERTESAPLVMPLAGAGFDLSNCCNKCLAARLNRDFTIIYVPANNLLAFLKDDGSSEILALSKNTILSIDHTLGVPPILFSTVLRC